MALRPACGSISLCRHMGTSSEETYFLDAGVILRVTFSNELSNSSRVNGGSSCLSVFGFNESVPGTLRFIVSSSASFRFAISGKL